VLQGVKQARRRYRKLILPQIYEMSALEVRPSDRAQWRVNLTSFESDSQRKPSARIQEGNWLTVKPTVAAGLVVLLSLHSWAGAHKPHSRQTVSADPGYVFALAAANRFLYAWQAGDLEAGMVLLSDGARHMQNPERFEEFFSAGDERAFEIVRGTGSRGRYRFGIVLVTAQGAKVRRRFSEIIVVNTGKNDWAVDKLP